MAKNLLKNKQVTLGLLIVLMLSVWVAVVYLPNQERIGDLKTKLADLRQKEKAAIPLTNIEMMQGVLDSLTSHLHTQQLRIYPESALLELGQAVNKIGKQYSLKLQSITPDYNSLSALNVGPGELSELNITIEFKGLFSNFTRFLDDIEGFPFAMRAQEVVFEKENINDRELKIELQGVVILRKERQDQDQNNLMNA